MRALSAASQTARIALIGFLCREGYITKVEAKRIINGNPRKRRKK
jgi:hypothetical protein